MCVICPDCGSNVVRDLGMLGELRSSTIAGQRVRVESGRLYRCNICNLAFRHPLLKAEEYNGYYKSLTVDYWKAESFSSFWRKSESMIFSQDLRPRSILDIGCYTGDFLSWLKERHQTLACYGVEPAEEAAAIAEQRGVKILGADILEVPKQTEGFDAIVMFDVFEHLPHIGECMEAAIKMLNSGGTLTIYSGNFDAWTWRLMRGDYYYTAIPEHVVFCSPRWCMEFSKRHNLAIVGTYKMANKRGALFQFVEQFVRNIIFKTSRVMQRNGFDSIDKIPLLNKAAEWDAPPGWSAAKDHILVNFSKNIET